MNSQKRKANNIDDIDVDAELEAGPSSNLFQKRGRTGTAEAGSRSGSIAPTGAGGGAQADGEGGEDDEDEAPAMEDDDYSAQLSWQSQSKENMKLLLSSFTPEQLARYETYRRSTLNKQSVRRFIHQSLGANVSVNVAQVVAGFSKVFVGEIIELGWSHFILPSLPAHTRPTPPSSPVSARAPYLPHKLNQLGTFNNNRCPRGQPRGPSRRTTCVRRTNSMYNKRVTSGLRNQAAAVGYS